MRQFEFDSEVIEWRGPAPFYFAPVPAQVCPEIKEAAWVLSYGWGVVPVQVTIGRTQFSTSLFPRQGGYLVPLKDAVRLPEQLSLGQKLRILLSVG